MTTRIPYSRHLVDEEDIAAVVQVLKGDWLTTGPYVTRFEEALAAYGSARYAIVFNSGTSALHAAYYVAGVREGHEVITTPISFAATANAALYLGAKPVFVDVTPDTINIDPRRVEKAVTSQTKVIAPVDFAGHPADLDELKTIARSIGAVVVEDACHALGASYKGRQVGSIADLTVFSFHPVKGITTGEGGAVLTDRPDFADALRRFRSHGVTKEPEQMNRYEGPWYYQMQTLGYNYRLSDIQCALGLSQLNKIEKFINRRRQIADIYNEALADTGLILPLTRPYVQHAWHLYPVQLPHEGLRVQMVRRLQRAGVGVQVHYIPIYHHPYYQNRGYDDVYLPRAETFYARCLSLPLYPGMTDIQVQWVIDEVKRTVSSLFDQDDKRWVR